ncbi:MAG TPA: hypothetical protein VHB21_06615 [Minicystis sp.]|nr:hypothetical protein [Minicystis sp.]
MRLSFGAPLAALALAVLVPLAAGCLNSACFVKQCDDAGRCTCSVSNCGEGSTFDMRTGRCRCNPGYLVVQGQCLLPEDANTFCGRGQHWEGPGCVNDRCLPGDELDLSTGKCLPREAVNAVAAQNLGVEVGQGQRLGCPEGQKLIVDGQNAVCVPVAQTCAHDETFDGKACVKVATCPAGSSYDAEKKACVAFVKPPAANEMPKVDVSLWANTNYGPNGGQGTAALCGSFAKKPYLFGVQAGSRATLRVTLDLAFPDGEVAKGTVKAAAVFDVSGAAVPPRGLAEVQASAASLLTALVKAGGKAATNTASTTVKCAVVSAGKPRAVPVPVPATGGL